MITAEQFTTATGYQPHDDDLDRCNCEVAGTVGHFGCGWCSVTNGPRFNCPVCITGGQHSAVENGLEL